MKLHDFTVTDINGKGVDLSSLKGKKVMIVNTASECGLTPQYADLEELYQSSKDKNLEIIGFPCNDFGAQEPGSEEQIANFCQKNYGVTFPMMSKVAVKGQNQHPLYAWLLESAKTKNQLSEVKWNFQKFLVDENGELAAVIEPMTPPNDPQIIDWING